MSDQKIRLKDLKDFVVSPQDKVVSNRMVGLDGNTNKQFMSALAHDFVVYGSLMADAHLGYSAPIGSVLATEDCIVPAWIGYDIGCSVMSARLTLTKDAILGHEQEIRALIKETVPTGTNQRQEAVEVALDPKHLTTFAQQIFHKRGGFHQMGTLGSGNHFIEIGADEEDALWVTIHCGSRGVGHGIAGIYMALAAGLEKPSEDAFPLMDNQELFDQYLQDQAWLLVFAYTNRLTILQQVMNALGRVLQVGLSVDECINTPHNLVVQEEGLWVHRKGACALEPNHLAVIAGNMRDGIAIVRGREDTAATSYSCSHGAGRAMGRNQAKKRLSLEEFQQQMTGIVADADASHLDEAPDAYKNLDRVLEAQQDVLTVEHRILPLINIKG